MEEKRKHIDAEVNYVSGTIDQLKEKERDIALEIDSIIMGECDRYWVWVKTDKICWEYVMFLKNY